MKSTQVTYDPLKIKLVRKIFLSTDGVAFIELGDDFRGVKVTDPPGLQPAPKDPPVMGWCPCSLRTSLLGFMFPKDVLLWSTHN